MEAIGTVLGLLIAVPIALFVITAAITVFALQVGIVLAVAGYLLGIPWSIGYRLVKGRWPSQ